MSEKIQITIRPRPDCKICWSKRTIKGNSALIPFGSGSCSLPNEFCDCVIEQIPDDENEYDITLTHEDNSEDNPLSDLTPGFCPHGFELAERCPDCKALAFENLINSAEIAAEMWDSNSASADPEEVHALLVDAVTAAKKFRGGK